MSALEKQVGGNHYKNLKIQPAQYCHANKIPFIEGCIIKYATRWRDKGGIKDLEKIIHFTEILLELEGVTPEKKAEITRRLMEAQESQAARMRDQYGSQPGAI